MSAGDLWLLVTVASLVLLAGAFSAADAALGSFSQARAGGLAAEERAGSKRLLHLLEGSNVVLATPTTWSRLSSMTGTRLKPERRNSESV
jgi:CBS domain containing-hemolysin-like protein